MGWRRERERERLGGGTEALHAKKTALHPSGAANDSGPYDTHTMVRDAGSLCRRGGGAFDLMRRQSNGCSTGDAQNDRDEQPWVLMPEKPEEKTDHSPRNPSG